MSNVSRLFESGVFRSLSIPNYRRYFAGAVISNTGTWMQRIAQDWLVLMLTDGNAFALGFTQLLHFGPTLFFGMFGGVLADRYDKRRVMQLTQGGVALVSVLLGILTITGVVNLWWVYAIALALGVANAIEAPARVAIASELVPPSDLVNAVGLNSASFNAARLVGPAIAGLLIGIFDTGPVFIINAVSSGIIILTLALIDPTKMHGVRRVQRESGQIRQTFAYVRQRPLIVLTIALTSFVSLFGLNLQVIIPLAATQVFGRGALDYGLLASTLAIGTLAGSLLCANRKDTPRMRSIVGTAALFGVGLLAIAWIDNFYIYGLGLIPVGLVSLYFLNSANALVQLVVESDVRGRVMALYMMFLMGTGALGGPFVGWIANVLDVQWAMAISGIATLLTAAVIGWLFTRRMGKVRVEASLRQRPRLQVHVGEERMIPYQRPERRDALEEII